MKMLHAYIKKMWRILEWQHQMSWEDTVVKQLPILVINYLELIKKKLSTKKPLKCHLKKLKKEKKKRTI